MVGVLDLSSPAPVMVSGTNSDSENSENAEYDGRSAASSVCPKGDRQSLGRSSIVLNFLFALPNQNADHSAPERTRITDLASFYEPLVAVQAVLMQLLGARPSVLPNQIDPCGEFVPLKAIVA
jgi:hypothetical protein